jgi:putative membrane protein
MTAGAEPDRRAWRRSPSRPPLDVTGEEPDPRFTLANERTFLAWTRTTLALLAAGLAVVEFLDSQPKAIRIAIGVPLMLLGAAVSVRSYSRWETVERALRMRQPLPYSTIPRFLGIGIGLIAFAAAVLVVVHG